eukprot:580864-Amphidinium_carterae.1
MQCSKDDEFEIHTPSPGASKWWPGGLGVLSTHCLLYARLILDIIIDSNRLYLPVPPLGA